MLDQAFGETLDDRLIGLGFRRRTGSLTYSRKRGAALQKIDFAVELECLADSEKLANIRAWIEIKFKDVSDVALALTNGDDFLLAGAPDVVLRQQVHFLAPKNEFQRWEARLPADFLESSRQIRIFLDRWVVPFLDDASSPAWLVRMYETSDGRVMRQRHWYIFVIAAYKILGRLDDARLVAQHHLGSPGLRIQFASVHNSLAQC